MNEKYIEVSKEVLKFIVLTFGYALFIWWLWNLILTDIGVEKITYWQAFGLRWLAGFLTANADNKNAD